MRIGGSALIVGAALMTGAAAPKVGVLTPAPPLNDSVEASTAWYKQNIIAGDDYFVTFSDKSAVLMTIPGITRTAQDFLRIWMRYENFNPEANSDGAIRSSKILTEFDCREQRYRALAGDIFAYNNNLGTPRSVDIQSAEWQYGRPGSVASITIKMVCDMKAEVDNAPPKANQGATWTYTPK